MPEGQFTGGKDTYNYRSDTGENYALKRDITLASVAGSGAIVIDPGTGVGGEDGVKPSQLKPRGVFWQGELNGRTVRKFLICFTPDSSLYLSNSREALTVDGVTGFITGRKGERLSF